MTVAEDLGENLEVEPSLGNVFKFCRDGIGDSLAVLKKSPSKTFRQFDKIVESFSRPPLRELRRITIQRNPVEDDVTQMFVHCQATRLVVLEPVSANKMQNDLTDASKSDILEIIA
ncbi:MAG: hypothetical protein Q9170_002431 [Blastenia crenularia]